MIFEVSETGNILHFKIPNETEWTITKIPGDLPWRLYTMKNGVSHFLESFETLEDAYTSGHKLK